MNPYQIMGIITICALLFATVVTVLAMQGMHVMAAFICVYVVAIGFMLSMQRRARQASEGLDHSAQRALDRETSTWSLSTSAVDLTSAANAGASPDQDRRRKHKFGV